MRALVWMLCCLPLAADSLDDLALDFWKWRAATQPFTSDDIPRLERPPGLAIDWSVRAVNERRQQLAGFEQRWKQVLAESRSWPVARQVDVRLIGSALQRVRFELDIERGWQRDPNFYVAQTLGAVFELLLPPPPISDVRAKEILLRMKRVPQTLAEGRANLTAMAGPFAKLAVDRLRYPQDQMQDLAAALQPVWPPAMQAELAQATKNAGQALDAYRQWLESKQAGLPASTAIGRDHYVWFLRQVALMPYSPEQLLDMGRQEWERSVAFETYEQNRNQGLPQLKLFPDQAAQIQREHERELEVRQFLEGKNLLTVPAWLQHYRNLPLPRYLAALPGLGVTDDLTGPSRLKENGISYIRPPAPTLGYFGLSTARDPRPILVHEGVPGHYFQLCLSWAHENPIRRYYYDSGANEGIGFYAEEMMLQAGYFDDSPRTREIIYNFMRLRALRVEVDVKLALGTFSIEQAAEYLAKTVPMDYGTARHEAAMFASTPGQAISYQIGKLQIVAMLAEARRRERSEFSLRRFHDFVWKNGNVPLSLQRWELLELPDWVPAAQ
jgi:hypothetical protein